jgi:hypothetical protein
MTATTPPAVRVQTWADDLRLPCFANVADTVDLLSALDQLRKPAIPFQSKHLPALKRDAWFVLRRPADRARTGLLCVWPRQRCCVYIAGEPPTPRRPTPRVALLRLRVDPQFYACGGLTVFAATLSATSRRLLVEDTLIWKGRPVQEEESFRARHRLAVQWLEHYAILDSRLIDGLEVQVAPWQSLAALEPEGTWELVQADEPGRRRLYWIANHAPPAYQSPAVAATATPPAAVPQLDLGAAAGPLVAIATRQSGPDQWAAASADGKQLGRLLVRTIAVSTELRGVKGNTVRVEVEWNAAFGKWELKRLSTALANHSSYFTAAETAP